MPQKNIQILVITSNKWTKALQCNDMLDESYDDQWHYPGTTIGSINRWIKEKFCTIMLYHHIDFSNCVGKPCV